MRTLIIGGTEFIGPHIVERLLKRGHEVTVLHRRAHHELGPNVRNLQADRGDLGAMARLLSQERPEAVFDLAYDWGKGTPAPHVLASARNSGDRLQRYVFMSSVAAYGPGVDRRESDPLAPDDIPNPYAQHKATSERALFRMREKSGFPVTTFRPPFVHGPRQPFYREQFFWDRLLDGRPIILPDGGHSPMQWVYVEDLAEACARAIEVPEAAGEAFNIAHTEKTSQRTFIEALGRTVGVEPRFVDVPREKIHDAGGDIFKGNLYFGEYLDLPPHTTIVEKAPRILGVTPTPLERALAAGFAWHRTQRRRPADYAFEDRVLSMA